MDNMFYGASAFNQPLSTFDTAKVEDVSAYFCRVQLYEKPDTDSLLLPNLSSDVMDVPRCSGLQPTPVNIQYGCGYGCECISLLSPTWWETRFLSLIPTQIIFRWLACSSMQRPSINYCQHSIRLRLQVWVHICAESDLMRNQILIFDSYPPCLQMRSMFYYAKAFNQPLSTFNTSVVTDVGVSLCRFRLDETPDSDSLLQPTY